MDGHKKLFLTLALAVFTATLATCQWQNAGLAQRCRIFEDPFDPGQTCDSTKGLQCQTIPGLGGSVCTCYSPFVYDNLSQECRRSLGYSCQPSSNQTIYERRSWFDKCPQGGSCVPLNLRQNGGFGRNDGRCRCRTSEGFVQFGAECVQRRRRRQY